MKPSRLRPLVLSLALAAGAAWHPAAAQPSLGAFEDATVLPFGTLRTGWRSQWMRVYDRYGVNTPGRTTGMLEPLGVDLTFDALTGAQYAPLTPIQTSVRALAGLPEFTASLGRVSTAQRNNQLVTPWSLEFGVTSRVTIGAMIPLVSAVSDVDLRVNTNTHLATVGFNPTRATAAVISANGALLTQFDAAASALTARLASCAATPSGPGCAALNANAAQAHALIQDATAFATGLGTLYGGRAGSGGAPFVPLVGSTAQSAIEARVAALKTQYAAFGSTGITASAPLGAQAPFTVGDLNTLLTDSTFGIRARAIESRVLHGTGDAEFTLKVNLIDGIGRARYARLLPPKGLHVRQSFGALYRLGSGTLDLADDFVDQGSGDHQTDIGVQSFTDLVWGDKWWMSVIARYTAQLADTRAMRIATPGTPFPAAYTEQRVSRDLGDVIEFELNPRYTVNQYVSLAAHYRYRSKSADQYTGSFSTTDLLGKAVTLDASVLDAETAQQEHRFGWGISYSSLSAVSRNKAKWPFEISYVHYETTRGSGGTVPKTNADQVMIRAYTRLFGR
jgi:hypothetical protein